MLGVIVTAGCKKQSDQPQSLYSSTSTVLLKKSNGLLEWRVSEVFDNKVLAFSAAQQENSINTHRRTGFSALDECPLPGVRNMES